MCTLNITVQVGKTGEFFKLVHKFLDMHVSKVAVLYLLIVFDNDFESALIIRLKHLLTCMYWMVSAFPVIIRAELHSLR